MIGSGKEQDSTQLDLKDECFNSEALKMVVLSDDSSSPSSGGVHECMKRIHGCIGKMCNMDIVSYMSKRSDACVRTQCHSTVQPSMETRKELIYTQASNTEDWPPSSAKVIESRITCFEHDVKCKRLRLQEKGFVCADSHENHGLVASGVPSWIQTKKFQFGALVVVEGTNIS